MPGWQNTWGRGIFTLSEEKEEGLWEGTGRRQRTGHKMNELMNEWMDELMEIIIVIPASVTPKSQVLIVS